MNGLPRFLPDLLVTIGVLYFDEWPSEASSHAMKILGNGFFRTSRN
jgi:hypothetical protein